MFTRRRSSGARPQVQNNADKQGCLLLMLLLVGLVIPVYAQGPQAQLSDDLLNEIPARGLRFEQSVGQFDEQVLFRVNDAQATHFFLEGEIRPVSAGRERTPKTTLTPWSSWGRRQGTSSSRRCKGVRKGRGKIN